MYQFLPGLRQEGIDVTVAPLIDDALLAARYARGGYPGASLLAAYVRRIGRLFEARRYDLVWIESELFLGCRASPNGCSPPPVSRTSPSPTTPCSTATISTRGASSAARWAARSMA